MEIMNIQIIHMVFKFFHETNLNIHFMEIIQEYSPYGNCIYMGGSWNGGSPINWVVDFMEHPN